MRYRRFGRTEWNVSEIGYGMWGMGGWTGSDDAESLDSLQHAVDLGCNFFDTACAFGLSLNRWEPANGVRAVRAGLVDAIQVIYNIFDQNPEDELFPACREKDVAVIARVPFDEGSLTGTLTLDSKWPKNDWRSTYFVPENLKASVARADALKSLLRDGMTLPEMALRFILNNPDVATIIPGMRKRKNVDSNLAASDKGPLPANLHAQLRPHRWDRIPTKWSQ